MLADILSWDVETITSIENFTYNLIYCDNLIDIPDVLNSNGWIKIEDRLPEKKDGRRSSENVLVFNRFLETKEIGHCLEVGGIYKFSSPSVSHWKPLGANPIINEED